MLNEPVQQLEEFAVFVCQDHVKIEIDVREISYDELGLLSRSASQALLHPTVFPEEFVGPTSCAGHPGLRSAGHEAVEQLAEGMIIIGILNPSTTDTANTPEFSLSPDVFGVSEGRGVWVKSHARTIVKVVTPVALERPFRHGCRRRTLHADREGVEGGTERKRRMCELGVCQYCRERTHSPGVGIALEPAVTAPVEAASRSIVRGKVTIPATLKTNEKEARARAQKVRVEIASRHGRPKEK